MHLATQLLGSDDMVRDELNSRCLRNIKGWLADEPMPKNVYERLIALIATARHAG